MRISPAELISKRDDAASEAVRECVSRAFDYVDAQGAAVVGVSLPECRNLSQSERIARARELFDGIERKTSENIPSGKFIVNVNIDGRDVPATGDCGAVIKNSVITYLRACVQKVLDRLQQGQNSTGWTGNEELREKLLSKPQHFGPMSLVAAASGNSLSDDEVRFMDGNAVRNYNFPPVKPGDYATSINVNNLYLAMNFLHSPDTSVKIQPPAQGGSGTDPRTDIGIRGRAAPTEQLAMG
ncbi:MAG: hypothetical protein J6M06_01875 [Synergistaceae bacterium]|nr:hypothetical protein [Synergistaceae bacterium]